jgi:hypothetical protein
MSDSLNMIDKHDNVILNNFASINKQIRFWPGKTLVTVSKGRRMMARAKSNMTIDRPFAIDNLSQLLNAIDLFSDPKIVMRDGYLTVQDNKHKMRYTFTDAENVDTRDPDENLEVTDSYQFDLSNDTLKDIQKASSVLGMPHVAFVGDGKKAYMQVINIKNPTSHLYSMPVGETTETFTNMVMQVSWLNKLLPDDYTVTLDFERQLAMFVSEDVEYFVSMEVVD